MTSWLKKEQQDLTFPHRQGEQNGHEYFWASPAIQKPQWLKVNVETYPATLRGLPRPVPHHGQSKAGAGHETFLGRAAERVF